MGHAWFFNLLKNMSNLLISADDHFNAIKEAIRAGPSEVTISSYGIYAGILPDGRDVHSWGDRFASRTREVLDELRAVPVVKFIIGLAPYASCRGKNSTCLPCERKFVRELIRHLNHVDLYPSYQWRMSNNLHIKCCLFSFGQQMMAIAGSRNFTDSTWEDITFKLGMGDSVRLYTHVSGLWEDATALTSKNVEDYLKSQRISEQAVTSIGI